MPTADQPASLGGPVTVAIVHHARTEEKKNFLTMLYSACILVKQQI